VDRHLLETATTVLEARLDGFASDDHTPGVVVGLVADGGLVHCSARGESTLGTGQPPDADTVFRIASMTKSFTAATVLHLRDEGQLHLDDPVAQWLPELADPAPFGVTLTLRHLLTMSAGFPTDDPWGDRQQDLPIADFDRLAARGFTTVDAPGTTFEYSNLGYALLGRVVAAATGQPFDEVVRTCLLGPLGLTATVFRAADLPDPARLASGYVPRGTGSSAPFDIEPVSGYGAFAPMGGLLSTVNDLAVWVAGFLAADRIDQIDSNDSTDEDSGSTDPGTDSGRAPASGPEHPLAEATRREMAQLQRFAGLTTQERPGRSPSVSAAGYGFGLFEEYRSDYGRVVSHSGGYPGFGSHMRWHPASGLGIIGLGNRTYSPMARLTARILEESLDDAGWETPRRALAPRTRDAKQAMVGLTRHFEDSVADEWFADNVDLDLPRTLRTAALERARADVGLLGEAEPGDPRDDGPARAGWRVPAERGALKVDLLMSPQRPMLVQQLQVEVVPRPSERLTQVAAALVATLNGEGGWPDGVAAADSVDPTTFAADARWCRARFGALELGRAVAGDGRGRATWRLTSARATAVPRAEATFESVELSVRLADDSDAAEVTLAQLRVPPRTVP